MTAVGSVRLERWHSQCPDCAEVGFVADGRLGSNDPFRKDELLLRELSGWSADAETLRRLVHTEAERAARTRNQRRDLPEAFAEASGDHEVHIDAGKVKR